MPSTYRGREKPVYGHEAVLTRPQLTAYIGAIATLWTFVEEMWGMLLAEMLEAEANVGIALYLAMKGSGPKNTVVSTISEMRLTASEQAMLATLVTTDRARALERNRVVHGRWGILPSKENKLVLFERNWTAKAMALISEHDAKGTMADLKFPTVRPEVWAMKDFQQIIDRIDAHARSVTVLREVYSSRRTSERATARALERQGVLQQLGRQTPPTPIGLQLDLQQTETDPR